MRGGELGRTVNGGEGVLARRGSVAGAGHVEWCSVARWTREAGMRGRGRGNGPVARLARSGDGVRVAWLKVDEGPDALDRSVSDSWRGPGLAVGEREREARGPLLAGWAGRKEAGKRAATACIRLG